MLPDSICVCIWYAAISAPRSPLGLHNGWVFQRIEPAIRSSTLPAQFPLAPEWRSAHRREDVVSAVRSDSLNPYRPQPDLAFVLRESELWRHEDPIVWPLLAQRGRPDEICSQRRPNAVSHSLRNVGQRSADSYPVGHGNTRACRNNRLHFLCRNLQIQPQISILSSLHTIGARCPGNSPFPDSERLAESLVNRCPPVAIVDAAYRKSLLRETVFSGSLVCSFRLWSCA